MSWAGRNDHRRGAAYSLILAFGGEDEGMKKSKRMMGKENKLAALLITLTEWRVPPGSYTHRRVRARFMASRRRPYGMGEWGSEDALPGFWTWCAQTCMYVYQSHGAHGRKSILTHSLRILVLTPSFSAALPLEECLLSKKLTARTRVRSDRGVLCHLGNGSSNIHLPSRFKSMSAQQPHL